jgi:hypothetical protein
MDGGEDGRLAVSVKASRESSAWLFAAGHTIKTNHDPKNGS